MRNGNYEYLKKMTKSSLTADTKTTGNQVENILKTFLLKLKKFQFEKYEGD